METLSMATYTSSHSVHLVIRRRLSIKYLLHLLIHKKSLLTLQCLLTRLNPPLIPRKHRNKRLRLLLNSSHSNSPRSQHQLQLLNKLKLPPLPSLASQLSLKSLTTSNSTSDTIYTSHSFN